VNPFQRIQYNKLLSAITHMELVEHPKTDAVHMTFEFAPEKLPAEFGVPPLALKKIADAMSTLVIPEMGERGKVEWSMDMGDMRLELKFNGERAEEARNAWPSITSAIQNLKSQHLLN